MKKCIDQQHFNTLITRKKYETKSKKMSKRKIVYFRCTYWDLLLNEVLNKNKSLATYYFIPAQLNIQTNKIAEDDCALYRPQRYYLGYEFGAVYLTKREAESVIALILTNTINNAGKKLKLSPRTVEFYLENVKKKLKCRKKKKLLNIIRKSKLLDYDFDYLMD